MSSFYESFSQSGKSVDSYDAENQNDPHGLCNINQDNVYSTDIENRIADNNLCTNTSAEPNITSLSGSALISSQKIGTGKRFTFLNKISTKNPVDVNKSRECNTKRDDTEKTPKRQFNLSFYDPDKHTTFWRFNKTEENPICDSFSHLSIRESESSISSSNNRTNSNDVRLFEKFQKLNIGNTLGNEDTVTTHDQAENPTLDFNIDLTVALKNRTECFKPEIVTGIITDEKAIDKSSDTSKNLVVVNGKLMSFNELLQLYKKKNKTVISYTPYNVPEGVAREECILDISPLANHQFPAVAPTPSPCSLVMRTRRKHVRPPLKIQQDLMKEFHPFLNVIHHIRRKNSSSSKIRKNIDQ